MSTKKRNSDDEKPNLDEGQNNTDESELSKLRLPQDFDTIVGAQKLTQHLPVKRPEKQWFVRTHHSPDMWFHAAVLDFQEDRETYIVESDLWNELASEIVPKVLIPSMTTQGHAFIWPIRLPGEDGRIDDWNRTARLAADLARKRWVRLMSNMAIGSYDTLVAAKMFPDPTWPKFGLEEWMRLGFKGKVIRSTDHPVVRRLRGEE